MPPVIRTIAPGARFLSLPDDRFSTSRLTVTLLLPLKEQTASANAILPFLLRRSCAVYPQYAQLQHRLNELYGARISAETARVGESQALILTAASIDDRFALHGEHVAAECAGLLRSMLFEPVLENAGFRPDEVEQEKRCLIELIESEINDKRLYARQRCEQLLCAGEGYAVNRYGSIEGVGALTPQSLVGSWEKALDTAQVYVICQGSDDGSDVARAFTEALGARRQRRPEQPVVNLTVDASRPLKQETQRMDISQSKLVIGLRTPIAGDNGQVHAVRLMNALLGGTPHSLLFRQVREKLSLCYYCQSGYDRHKGVMLIDSGVQESNAARAQQEILAQLSAIREGRFSTEDLEAARLSLVNQFQAYGDSQSTLASWYLGQSLDETLITPEQTAQAVGRVTREQVIAAADSVVPGVTFLLAGEESA